MQALIEFGLMGIALGLSSGVAPGPLLTLTISETLKHGAGGGTRVACAPLVTDGPLIALSWLVLSRLDDLSAFLGVLSFLGAAFLLYLGIDGLRFRGTDLSRTDEPRRSFQKGVLTNILNPAPYIFWATVGGPLIFKASSASNWAAVLFLLGFIVCFVGAKVMVAMLVTRFRDFLRGPAYVWLMRGMGLMLVVFALMFFREGLGYF